MRSYIISFFSRLCVATFFALLGLRVFGAEGEPQPIAEDVPVAEGIVFVTWLVGLIGEAIKRRRERRRNRRQE